MGQMGKGFLDYFGMTLGLFSHHSDMALEQRFWDE
jgi:hypothetical protein